MLIFAMKEYCTLDKHLQVNYFCSKYLPIQADFRWVQIRVNLQYGHLVVGGAGPGHEDPGQTIFRC